MSVFHTPCGPSVQKPDNNSLDRLYHRQLFAHVVKWPSLMLQGFVTELNPVFGHLAQPILGPEFGGQVWFLSVWISDSHCK